MAICGECHGLKEIKNTWGGKSWCVPCKGKGYNISSDEVSDHSSGDLEVLQVRINELVNTISSLSESLTKYTDEISAIWIAVNKLEEHVFHSDNDVKVVERVMTNMFTDINEEFPLVGDMKIENILPKMRGRPKKKVVECKDESNDQVSK